MFKQFVLFIFESPNQSRFAIFGHQNRAKIAKFGLVRTLKNDFFKNLFFQKFSPSNSEQVSKILLMVKIISMASRNDFLHFMKLFTTFHGLFFRLRSIFRRFFKFVHSFPKNLANQSSWNFCQMLELPSCVANKLFRSIRWTLKNFFFWRKKKTSILSKNQWFSEPP